MRLLSGKSSDQVWTKTIAYYSTYTHSHLKPIALKLAESVKAAPSAKLKAIHSKYKSEKLECISLRSELSGSRLDTILTEE